LRSGERIALSNQIHQSLAFDARINLRALTANKRLNSKSIKNVDGVQYTGFAPVWRGGIMPLDRAQTSELPIRHVKLKSRSFACLMFNSYSLQPQSAEGKIGTRVNPTAEPETLDEC
jgi:hypothetical protein